MIIKIKAATFRQTKSLFLMVQNVIQEIFRKIFAADSKIAVCDPVYPVYVDTNVMAGRTGTYDAKTETWSNVIYMPCTKETNFAPALPEETPDIIYLCFPE